MLNIIVLHNIKKLKLTKQNPIKYVSEILEEEK